MFSVNSKRPRRIALVDCNNFYASCERVFQPAWADRAIGVLSNNDGCIIARSNELKEAGIPMGAPYFQVRDQLEAINAVVVSSNYALYGDMSARVMNTLSQFTPDLEVYSIDEAWLDLTGFNPAIVDAYARGIVTQIEQHTGIPVSMGIAPTKVLAKIANRICKQRKIPGRVFNLGNAEALDGILGAIAVEDIWGISARWGSKLRVMGINTAQDLRNVDPEMMRQRFNVVMQRLVLELRGISCLGAEEIQPKHQIIASRSFGERVTDLESLQQAVSLHASRAGEKLRAQGSVCGVIQVSIRTGRHQSRDDFYANAAVIELPVPTSDTRRLIDAARDGVSRIYQAGYRYAKAGVMLLDITAANAIQGNLFQARDANKAERLMQTMDWLNRVYGRRTIFFASLGMQPSWRMRRERMTPAYTTRWQDLPVVR